MIIAYGQKNISFRLVPFIILFLILFTDQLLLDLVIGESVSGEPREGGVGKILLISAFGISLISLNGLHSYVRNWTIVVFFYTLYLILESFYVYNSFFIYPHVFAKILALYLIPVGYLATKKYKNSYLYFLVVVILIGFALQSVTYKREAYSIAAFLQTERGFPASSVYLLLLPCLFFLNKYLIEEKYFDLFLFFFVIALIIFFQHRTVWLSTAAALTINFILLKKTNTSVTPGKLLPIVIIPVIVGVLVSSFVLSTNPEIITKFGERVSDIQNYKSEGTGSWRYIQFQSYLPFIEENIIAGMRFRGFELPVQFYHPEAGVPYFPDGTGHHFHSFYVDRLFYFGIIGLILIVPIYIFILNRCIQMTKFNTDQIILVAFVFSGIIYGVSYNWPDFFFGIIGVTLASITYKNRSELSYEESY